jgi:hypothetical protein
MYGNIAIITCTQEGKGGREGGWEDGIFNNRTII